jgi:hypothetical protein
LPKSYSPRCDGSPYAPGNGSLRSPSRPSSTRGSATSLAGRHDHGLGDVV